MNYTDDKRQAIWAAAMGLSNWMRKHGMGPIRNEQIALMMSETRAREAIDMLHVFRDSVGAPANLVARAMLAINAEV